MTGLCQMPTPAAGAGRGHYYHKRAKGQLYVEPKRAELIEAESRMVATRELGVGR